MKVLMIGCDESTKGGMWKVVDNYLTDARYGDKVDVEYIPTSITGDFWKKILFTWLAYCKILKRFIENKPDILHVHMSERGSVFRKGIIMIAADLCGIKIILHMHGAEFEVWYRNSKCFMQSLVKSIVNRADKVIILGEYWKPFISTIYPIEDICVLHNAVEVPIENKYNTKSKDILFLGVIGKRKGAYDLLYSFYNILNELPQDVRLIYYGPNPENDLLNRIRKLNIETRVIYKGWLPDNQKASVFENVQINVLPSYNEGLPMTILETMAYGIPNISTNVAAIPEVVNDTNGILINAGDTKQLSESIMELINNSEERIKKSGNAYTTIKKQYSIDIHIDSILKLYKDVLSK
ncbi:glycosyltransferase family 4 protein [Faecalibaculum rodentium]|uniref:glycosyltransferase family 4 protein n=1 Tax=Faecalibaculum rodentium TaxID=1702221 RepID=UPI0023F35C76|nr:glycosyltransferase family 4 protein [Faecalibaculum rodentium]